MRFLFGKHHSFKLPCDFEDPGVLKRSSFSRKIRIIPGDPFIAPPISQGSQVSTPVRKKDEMGWIGDHMKNHQLPGKKFLKIFRFAIFSGGWFSPKVRSASKISINNPSLGGKQKKSIPKNDIPKKTKTWKTLRIFTPPRKNRRFDGPNPIPTIGLVRVNPESLS